MSTLVLVLRVFVSLGVVVALMVAASRLAARRGLGPGPGVRPGGSPPPLEVVARRGLGRRAAVVVVRAGERHLVLGVTDTSVRLLDELTVDPQGSPEKSDRLSGTTGPGLTVPTPAWRALLERAREMTVRR